MISNSVKKNRSYRKFYEEIPVDMETMEELVELARLSPSGMNLQSLKFLLVNKEQGREAIYPNIKWAAYLKAWGGPKHGERPAGFILIFNDKSIPNSPMTQIDLGIACQSMLLGAVEKGLGGCIIGNINKAAIYDYFKIEKHLELQLIIALGSPNQNVIIDEIENGDDIKYWTDDKDNHHVPKRKLQDIIIKRD